MIFIYPYAGNHSLFKIKTTYKTFSTEIPKRQLVRLTNCFVMLLIT